MGSVFTKVKCPAKDCHRHLAALYDRGVKDGAWISYTGPGGERLMRCPVHGVYLEEGGVVGRRIIRGTA